MADLHRRPVALWSHPIYDCSAGAGIDDTLVAWYKFTVHYRHLGGPVIFLTLGQAPKAP